MDFLDAIDPEWSQMWEDLSGYDINRGDPICVFEGSCWEYMGSTRDHHHLRHNCHPFTDKAEFAYIERRKIVAGWV